MKRKNLKVISSIIIIAITVFFISRNSVVKADAATVINITTAEEFLTAISTIHSNSDKTYVLELNANIELSEDAGSNDKLKIDNNNNVTINGNGHTIKFSISDGKMINVSNATLNLKGGSGTLSFTGPSSGGREPFVTIYGGTVNMYNNVTLSDNFGKTGAHFSCGGVSVQADGTFNMYGGTIENIRIPVTEFGGAAVHLDQPGGVFNMYGGEISNCYCVGYGGALFATNTTEINIQNATLTGNEAKFYGGMAFIDDAATMRISNSTIKNNSAMVGGAITNYGTTILNNNVFSNNTTSYYGGAIFSEGNITSVNDDISKNTSDIYAGGVCINNGTADFSKSKVYNNTANSGANDFYVSANTTEISVMEPGLMGKEANIGGESVTVNLWRNDNPGDRYSLTNKTDAVLAFKVSAGTTYLLTAGTGGCEVSYDEDGDSDTSNVKRFVEEDSIVKLDPNGGTCSATEISIAERTEIENPTRSGYIFKGWAMVESDEYDLVLKANWEKDSETTTENSNTSEENNNSTPQTDTPTESVNVNEESSENPKEEPADDNDEGSTSKVKTGDTIMKWITILFISAMALGFEVRYGNRHLKVKAKRLKK